MDEGRRKAQRRSVSLLVKLKHPNVATFEEDFATNLSEGGMFIRSRQPQPVGTHLKFEVQLAGGQRVMRGTAVVKWIRQAGDPSGGPGMGVQFEQLDDATRTLVDRMLGAKRAPAAAPAGLPPEVAALEAELKARYGDPPAAAAAPLPSVAPLAQVAPVIAPAVHQVKPDLAPPLYAEDEPLAPAPAGDDAPLASDEIPIEFETTPTPDDAIEIPLDALLEASPAPAAKEEEVPLELDVDVSGEGAEIPVLEGLELSEEPPAGALDASSFAPPPPPPKEEAKAPQLPEVRREAPPPPAAAPTLLKAEPKPEAPKQAAGPVFLKPPERIPETGPVIGIDLGTTNSCVALLQNGRPTILRSKEGYNTLPTIISLTAQGKLLLAHRAKSQLILNPSQTVYGAKRLVGRAYDSAVVRQVRERFHYQVVADGAGRAAVALGDHVLTLEEVQGLILNECRELAEQTLEKKVSRAVITVPAYYSEPQREAVRRAGALAGLKVERILNEPTAAALAFGLNKELNKKVLVYDLGGGTFDATLLRIEKNVFEVLGTGGDVFLGGIDFDNLLVDMLLKRFQETQGIPFEGDQVAFSRITEAAEKAKVALSERQTHDVHIPMLMMDDKGQPKDLRCTLKREDVEAAAMPLVDRTLEVVGDVLLDAQVKAKDVDEIILVGGMSRMPLVRERLKAMFGKAAHAGVNADEAVALGAALYCGTVDKVSSVTLIDVLPMTVGVGLPGGGFRRVIERNTPLPAQRSFALATSKDNETTIEFSVFQGEESNVAGNEYLGTVRIEDLPKAPRGVVKVAVTLRLDPECVLLAEAAELSTRKAVKVTLATRYTPEEVQARLGITQEKAREVEAARAKELEGRAGGFWGFLKKVVGRKKK